MSVEPKPCYLCGKNKVDCYAFNGVIVCGSCSKDFVNAEIQPVMAAPTFVTATYGFFPACPTITTNSTATFLVAKMFPFATR